MLDAVINIIFIGIALEGYYRFRKWFSGLRYKWTCTDCLMFSCAASDKNTLERVKAAHQCSAMPV